MCAAERNAIKSFLRARKEQYWKDHQWKPRSTQGGTCIEQSLLPSAQDVLCEDRQRLALHFDVLLLFVVVIDRVFGLKLQQLPVVFLEVLEELGVLFRQLGKFVHVRGAFVCRTVFAMSNRALEKTYLPSRRPKQKTRHPQSLPPPPLRQNRPGPRLSVEIISVGSQCIVCAIHLRRRNRSP